MDLNIEILQLAKGLSTHASHRQAVIARNVANADTPGFKARDLQSFATLYDSGGPPPAMRATRAGHLQPAETARHAALIEDNVFGADSPNGNTVSLEDQLVRSTEIQKDFTLALGVYRKTLDILRTSLGPRR